MSGFGFGMFRFPGDNVLLLIILLGLMVPFEAVIIPLWQIMGDLGLRDTYWALIFPQVALSFSFGTFWMRANFKNMPTGICARCPSAWRCCAGAIRRTCPCWRPRRSWCSCPC